MTLDAPDHSGLRDAALRHLGRYATSEAGLLRVLDRSIDRWALKAKNAEDRSIERMEAISTAIANSRLAARRVVSDLRAVGAVDDVAFANQRGRSLARAGRSSRAVAGHLRARGIDPDLVAQVGQAEAINDLAAALVYVRRRRFGGFRPSQLDDDVLRKELGALARMGFAAEIARRALKMPQDEAVDTIAKFRRGDPIL